MNDTLDDMYPLEFGEFDNEDWQDDDWEEYADTGECICPYCPCSQTPEDGVICNDCRNGVHQG